MWNERIEIFAKAISDIRSENKLLHEKITGLTTDKQELERKLEALSNQTAGENVKSKSDETAKLPDGRNQTKDSEEKLRAEIQAKCLEEETHRLRMHELEQMLQLEKRRGENLETAAQRKQDKMEQQIDLLRENLSKTEVRSKRLDSNAKIKEGALRAVRAELKTVQQESLAKLADSESRSATLRVQLEEQQSQLHERDSQINELQVALRLQREELVSARQIYENCKQTCLEEQKLKETRETNLSEAFSEVDNKHRILREENELLRAQLTEYIKTIASLDPINSNVEIYQLAEENRENEFQGQAHFFAHRPQPPVPHSLASTNQFDFSSPPYVCDLPTGFEHTEILEDQQLQPHSFSFYSHQNLLPPATVNYGQHTDPTNEDNLYQ